MNPRPPARPPFAPTPRPQRFPLQRSLHHRFLQHWVPWCALALVAYAALWALPGWDAHLGMFLVWHGVAWIACVGAARSNAGLGVLLIGAVVFRAAFVPLDPVLSDDIFRYVWEGRVQWSGYNPFVHAPDSPLLAPLRDDVWERINHPSATAIYPPLAQLVFKLLALGGGVTFFKAALCVADLGLVLLLAQALRRRARPIAGLALYAWNPLPIVEVAGSGHLEPLALLPLVAAITWARPDTVRRGRAWVGLAASIGVKYGALLLVPFFWRACRPAWRDVAASAGLLCAATLPYLDAGPQLFDSLRMYADKWRYNDMLFALIAAPIGSLAWAKVVAAALFVVGMLTIARRGLDLATTSCAALVLVLLLSPTIHPWYLLWAAVFLPLVPSRAVLLWSGTIVLAYWFQDAAFGTGPVDKGNVLLRLVQITPVGVGLWFDRRLLASKAPERPPTSGSEEAVRFVIRC